ncbi:hypothetical protein [Phenylobacterium sp.]|jgi:hypothetical protein|uniref:hypothetical protein n=1 Tax=Phenylobacterium sp. TaxID=1871053 RepID=UPI003782EB82
MAEVDFERRLERLFAEAPAFADSGAFAEQLERRLDRGWRVRRWLIGAAGLAGGVVAASQLMVANIGQRVQAAEDSARLLRSGLGQIAPNDAWMSLLGGGGAVVWVASGLAVLAMGFVLTRVIEEI